MNILNNNYAFDFHQHIIAIGLSALYRAGRQLEPDVTQLKKRKTK